MKKIYSSVLTSLVASGLVFAASAQAADNGLAGSDAAAVPALAGPIGTQVNGPWLEFLFGGVGSEAEPCGGCTPSSGGNSVYLTSNPPWTFSLPFGGGTLTVTDAFQNGDVFDVYDDGSMIGTTSTPGDGSCGSDPAICLPDPDSSSGEFPLIVGDHAVTLYAAESPFGGGAAYFRVDTAAELVDIDIKFCSNPNAFNSKRTKGGFPVTIFGNGVDVSDIDLDTLQLCLDAAGTVCTTDGLHSYSIADRGDPTTDLGAAECAIVDDIEMDYLNPDGNDDLDAVFDAGDVADLIGPSDKWDEVGPLYLVGYLNDSTPITSVPTNSLGTDMLLIVK